MKNKEIKVILLVAGEGTRLRPYTIDRPKCMVEIDGISLLDRQLSVLKQAYLNKIVMIGGYKSHMLKRDGIVLRNNPKYYETNMLWTLFCAEDELDGEIIISYGDIVYSKSILDSLMASKADIAVTIDMNWESYWRARNENPLDDAETLKLNYDMTISEIGQKPKSLEEIQGQYMGLMKLSRKGVVQMKKIFHSATKNNNVFSKPPKNAYMTDILQALINSGKPVTAVPIYDSWIEVDTVDDLTSKITLSRCKEIDC